MPPTLRIDTQLDAWLGYTDAFLDQLKYHHEQEDDIIFPAMRACMEKEVDGFSADHRALAELMAEMRAYVADARQNHAHFQSEKFVDIATRLQVSLRVNAEWLLPWYAETTNHLYMRRIW